MSKRLFPEGKLIIYTDGGSRGNPGRASIGVVVGGKKYKEYIGIATNNVAEYKAIVFALRKAKQLLGKVKAKKSEIEIKTDSQLIAKQMNGEYKIMDVDLQPLFLDVWNSRLDFKKVIFIHIPREQNTEADRLVNEALDER